LEVDGIALLQEFSLLSIANVLFDIPPSCP
jgi:hypothetical protein